jgi:FKBP-type peptidyl-prolyl cis-trans isomerase FkpA
MRVLLVLLALGVAPAALAQAKGAKPLATDQEKTLYAVGVVAADSFKVFQLTPSELAIVQRGLSDAVAGKTPAVDMKVYGPKVNQLAAQRTEASSKATLAKWAQAKGAVSTASGLVYVPSVVGTGKAIGPDDMVKLHFEARLPDGQVVESSRKKGEPVDIQLARAIKCWNEGFQKMRVGGRATLVCPPALGYGERGMSPNIPGGATLIFDVEILDAPATMVPVKPSDLPAKPVPAK